MYSNVHCFCLFYFFHFIILIRQSKKIPHLICQRETGFKKIKSDEEYQMCIFTLAYGTGRKE